MPCRGREQATDDAWPLASSRYSVMADNASSGFAAFSGAAQEFTCSDSPELGLIGRRSYCLYCTPVSPPLIFLAIIYDDVILLFHAARLFLIGLVKIGLIYANVECTILDFHAKSCRPNMLTGQGFQSCFGMSRRYRLRKCGFM